MKELFIRLKQRTTAGSTMLRLEWWSFHSSIRLNLLHLLRDLCIIRISRYINYWFNLLLLLFNFLSILPWWCVSVEVAESVALMKMMNEWSYWFSEDALRTIEKRKVMMLFWDNQKVSFSFFLWISFWVFCVIFWLNESWAKWESESFVWCKGLVMIMVL